jgi:hypothetical protein
MLKLTALALGLLTVIAIAPASQAATTVNPVSLHQAAGDLHAQVIVKIGEQGQHKERREYDRRYSERPVVVRRHHDKYHYEGRRERHEDRHERHEGRRERHEDRHERHEDRHERHER